MQDSLTKILKTVVRQWILPPAAYTVVNRSLKTLLGVHIRPPDSDLRRGDIDISLNADDHPEPDTPDPALIQEIHRNFRLAKRDQTGVPLAYKPGAGWAHVIQTQWNFFLDAVEAGNSDELERFFQNFFRYPIMEGFWGETIDTFLHLGGADLFSRQFAAWREMEPAEDVGNLEAPPIGNPWGFEVSGRLLIQPMLEYWWQAGYFKGLLSTLDRPLVVEIGGGFGGLAYALGRRIHDFCYVGFDLPENIALQHYYLARAYPDKKVAGYGSVGTRAMRMEDLLKHDVLLLPNFMLDKMPSGSANMVINVRSLAEMPDVTIAEYLRQIERICKGWFFHENIYKQRKDARHGIPSPLWPPLHNFAPIARSISRWPRYSATSAYPCAECLYLRKDCLALH